MKPGELWKPGEKRERALKHQEDELSHTLWNMWFYCSCFQIRLRLYPLQLAARLFKPDEVPLLLWRRVDPSDDVHTRVSEVSLI